VGSPSSTAARSLRGGGGPLSLRGGVAGHAPFAAAVAELGARGGAAARVSDPSDRLGEGVAHSCPLDVAHSSSFFRSSEGSRREPDLGGGGRSHPSLAAVGPCLSLDAGPTGSGARRWRRSDPGTTTTTTRRSRGARVSGSDWARRRARETGSRGKPGSVAGGLENGLAGGVLVFFLFFFKND